MFGHSSLEVSAVQYYHAVIVERIDVKLDIPVCFTQIRECLDVNAVRYFNVIIGICFQGFFRLVHVTLISKVLAIVLILLCISFHLEV